MEKREKKKREVKKYAEKKEKKREVKKICRKKKKKEVKKLYIILCGVIIDKTILH